MWSETESCSLASEHRNPKFWFQFWLLLSFVPEDLIISWRLSLKLWKRRGICEIRCGCISSLRDCSTFKDALGPNIGKAKSAESRWWRRIYFSIVTSLQCFETGINPGALNTERHSYAEQAATFLPRKCSSLISVHSHAAPLQKPIVKPSKSKLQWMCSGIDASFSSPKCEEPFLGGLVIPCAESVKDF